MPKNPDEMPQKWRQTEIRGAQGTNAETGELIELGDITGHVAVAPRRGKNRREIKFMLVDIEAMPKLKMSKGEWSLFWQVVSHTDRERGEARVTTKELADAIGWNGPNTSRALKKMTDRGILIKLTVGAWMVSPRLMSRKAVEKWEIEMRSAPEIDWEGES